MYTEPHSRAGGQSSETMPAQSGHCQFVVSLRDATLIEIGSISIPVASIAHLIAMKTNTGRSKDLIDIEELRKIQAQK